MATTTTTRPKARATPTKRRLPVYVQNPQDLDLHRRWRGLSYQQLADAVTVQMRGQGTCSKAYAHRLCTSTRSNQPCGDNIAVAMAKVLDAPVHALFRTHLVPARATTVTSATKMPTATKGRLR